MNKKIIFNIAKYLLALIFLVFGSNKLIGFLEMPPLENPDGANFLGAVFSSYLGKFLGVMEIVGAILLLVPKTSFLGLLVLAPILFNIAFFHFAHDFPGNPAWILTFVLGVIVAFSHQDRIKGLVE